MVRNFIRCILGPLLFSIFICDLFFIVKEIDFASYADDNTPFVSGDKLDDVLDSLENAALFVSSDRLDNVLDSLENAALKLFDWFPNNQMKANPDKCRLLVSTTSSIALKTKIMRY